MKKRITWLWVLCLLVTACSIVPSNRPPRTPQQLSQLQQLQEWSLQGAVSIRTPQRTILAHMQWQQQQRNYNIHLSGPFNVGGVQITGGLGHITLTGSRPGQVILASSPEELSQKQLGVRLPISNLYYWIRGIPAPSPLTNRMYDAQHHLVFLQQQGWTIHYMAYTPVNGLDLPSQMLLSGDNIQMKIVIKRWTITH